MRIVSHPKDKKVLKTTPANSKEQFFCEPKMVKPLAEVSITFNTYSTKRRRLLLAERIEPDSSLPRTVGAKSPTRGHRYWSFSC
jgi:hypothetical protein